MFCFFFLFCFFKQKTAYEMRISDWSSDVCSSDLDVIIRRIVDARGAELDLRQLARQIDRQRAAVAMRESGEAAVFRGRVHVLDVAVDLQVIARVPFEPGRIIGGDRSVAGKQIGRASGRERVCQYSWIPGSAVSLKKKTTHLLHAH